MWNPYDRNCPSRRLLDLIGDRWTVLVVGALGDGPRRFSSIQASVDGVSQKMLTQTLRALERDGLVERRIFAEVPPRVEYELTEVGESLREPLRTLTSWASDHMSQVQTAQHAFDAARDQLNALEAPRSAHAPRATTPMAASASRGKP